MYHQFNIQQFYVLPTKYLCVLCGSENKQRLFHYTALTDWFLWHTFNPLQPSGLYIYHQFIIQQFCVLSTQYIHVFCVDLRTNSDYFIIQHWLTGFYNRDLTLYSPVVTICTTSLSFNNSAFCPHSIFMCFFVWIWEQTAIISLYSIDLLVFITEM